MRGIGPYLLLAALTGALVFLRLGATPLIGLDEGLYAECSREMLAGGNYIVPTFNGQPFLDKPPLVYWLQAASMSVFGVNSFAVRLPSALAVALLVAGVVYLGTRLFGARAGLLSGFVLVTSVLAVALGRLCLLDAALALTIAISMGAFVLAHTGVAGRWAYLLFWAAAGLSVMVKGPAGAVLILTPTALFLLVRKEGRSVGRTMPVVGIIIFAAVAVPWYALVQRETRGAFLKEFLIHQNLQRAAGQDFYHNQPLWFYIPIYAFGFFPWSAFVPLAWARHVRLKPESLAEQAGLFAAVWLASTIVIFSLSRSKLPSYIFPAFPASALLVGVLWADEGERRGLRSSAVAALVLSVMVAAAMLLGQSRLPRPIPGLAPTLALMAGGQVLGCSAAAVLLYRQRTVQAFAALSAGAAASLVVAAAVGLPIASRSLSQPAAEIARHIAATPPDTMALAYRLSPPQPAVSFYAQRFVLTIDTRPELICTLGKRRRAVVVVQRESLDHLPRGCQVLAHAHPYYLYEYRR